MKISKKHLLAFGIGVYLVALIATFPADRAYGWFRPAAGSNLPVRLYGIDGTLWAGTASQAEAYGRTVKGLSWRLHPLALLLGRLEVALNVPYAGGRIDGVLRRPLTGQDVSILDPHVDLPLAPLMAANRFPIPLSGHLTGDLTRINISETGNVEIDTGDLLIRDLTVEGTGKVPLGGFKVRIDHDAKGALIIKATDTGGALKLNATITLPTKDRYALTAELGARDTGNAVLMQSLRMLGAPDRTGTFRIQRQGSIKQDLALFGL